MRLWITFCAEATIANNLFGSCGRDPVNMLCRDRILDLETNRKAALVNNRVVSNVFYGFGQRRMTIPKDGGNLSNYNVFLNPPDGNQFNLAAWRQQTGHGSHSVTCVSRTELSPNTWTLQQTPLPPHLEVPRESAVRFDFFD